jgi:hypothetical protein
MPTSDRDYLKTKPSSYRKDSDSETRHGGMRKYEKLPLYNKYDKRTSRSYRDEDEEEETWYECIRDKVEEILEVTGLV